MGSIIAFIKKTKTSSKILIAIIIVILGINLLFFLENKDKILKHLGVDKTKNEEKIVEQSNKRNELLNQLIVNIDFINNRSSSSKNSKILGKVYKDEIYTILDIKSDNVYY